MLYRSLAAVIFSLAAMPTIAADGRWVVYGINHDGSKHSWNKDDFSVNGDRTFELTAKAIFTSPRQIPGKNSLPPASFAITRFLVNCETDTVQPVSGSFLDASGQEIRSINSKGPIEIADRRGDRERDRLVDSFCSAVKNYRPPARLP